MEPNSSPVRATGSGYVGRFAPSPTGPLHLGSLLAALGSWLIARSAGGRWLLRIEDIDPPRERAGAALAQIETLQRCGLEHDGEIVWQHARHALYRRALDRLLDAGLAFSCQCSRSDLTAQSGIHRRCVDRPSGHRPAIRLRVQSGEASRVHFSDRLRGPQQQDVANEVGDFVLLRSDGCWAYQLAVVVDDAEQCVTEVVRGADLLDSTARQILLQRALALPTPSHVHLPLVLDASGNKLSKSEGALAVDATDPLPALRACWSRLGQEPAAVAHCGSAAGFLRAALPAFEFSRVPRGDAFVECQNKVGGAV